MAEVSSPPSHSPVIVRPVPLKWHQRFAAVAIYGCAKALTATWQQGFKDESGVITRPDTGPVIFAIWHNRLAACMVAWHGYVRGQRPTGQLAALISASKDGGLLANVLNRFGVQPIRGSSSRRGRQALLESTSAIENGFCVAITPDGPRGPKYQVQPGVAALAQLTGAPIVPVIVRIKRRVRLKSWDAFQIPLPFARIEITFGEAIHIPRDADEAQRAEASARLKSALGDD